MIERGQEPPPHLYEQEPHLDPDAEPYWSAFWRLCRSRPVAVGMGVVDQPMDYLALRACAQDFDFYEPRWAFDRFLRLMQAMDDEQRRIAAEKRERAAEMARMKQQQGGRP